jgi:hypothetical protein
MNLKEREELEFKMVNMFSKNIISTFNSLNSN